jgi:hypothetical protein
MFVFVRQKSCPENSKIYLISSRSYKLLREISSPNLNFEVTRMLFKSEKLILVGDTSLLVANISNCKLKQSGFLPTEQVFITKKKDYNSSPSERVRMKNGLTFVDS